MPVHISELTSNITLIEGELPLSPSQLDKLVKLVMARMAQTHRDEQSNREATKLRRQSSSPFEVGS